MKSNNSNTDSRLLAIEWWNKQSREFRNSQFAQYKKETFSPASHFSGLTGREIESIFNNLGLSERAIKESTVTPAPDYMEWWGKLTDENQLTLSNKHFGTVPESLAPKGIGWIYNMEVTKAAEHPQPLKEDTPDTGTVTSDLMGYEFFGDMVNKSNFEMLLPVLKEYDKLKATNDSLVSALQDMIKLAESLQDAWSNESKKHGGYVGGSNLLNKDNAPILFEAKQVLNNLK